MANETKTEIPYTLVPDYDGYPNNSPLRTFEWVITDDEFNKMVDLLMDPENSIMPDGYLIEQKLPKLFDTLMARVKEIEPDWQDYQGIEIYIPEICHMASYIKQCQQGKKRRM